MTLSKAGFADGALEHCFAQANSASPALSASLRVIAGSLFALVAAAGAWCVFVVCDASLGWRLAALTALVYLFVIGGLQVLLVDRFSAAFRRVKTERDDALELSAERETMLAETQHRIGNNLAAISSMLSLQGRRLGDGVARHAIEGAAGRIRVVGEVNRMFNRLTSNDARIDNAFVADLTAHCVAALGAEDRVRYETSIDPIDMPKRNLLLVALILNECLNNALEHGFPGDASGTITIRLEASREAEGTHCLTVEDDGVGPPVEFDSAEARTAGLVFVNSFTVQIGGSFRLESRARGARSVLIF